MKNRKSLFSAKAAVTAWSLAMSHTASTAYVTSNAASKANIYFLTNILFTIRPCTFWRTM